MLTKNKHPRVNYISRLLVLPLLVIVFAAFTIKAREYKEASNNITKTITAENIINNIQSQKITSSPQLENANYAKNETIIQNILTDKQIIVVIDAGHGGIDNGAINKDGLTEKDLALQLVRKIKEANKNENIKIILTRETDIFQNVKEKAAFANEHHADLFISIHLDNTPKEKWNTVSGLKVYVAKDGITNTEKSKLLASAVIGSFRNNYGLDVDVNPQQRQIGIWVLQANNFPSIMIEAGYLTNDGDAAYLLTKKGQETFANNVLNAINNFAEANDFTSSNSNLNTNQNREQYREQIKPHLVDSETDNDSQDHTSADSKAVNLLQEVFKDSNETVILLYGKRIHRKLGWEMLKSDTVNLTLYPPENAFKKFGIRTKNGIADITKRYAKEIQIDPVFRIGNLTSGRIKVDEFKKQKFATVTDGFEFVSCNVYFGGTGFPKAEATNLNGNDFTQLNAFLERCAAGTSIAFTNIKVKNKDGMRTIEEKAYTLY